MAHTFWTLMGLDSQVLNWTLNKVETPIHDSLEELITWE